MKNPIPLLTLLFLAACSPGLIAAPAPTPKPTQPIIASPIPVSNTEGTVVAEQPGYIEWVLLSGVDEHGLYAEHELTLLLDADPNADPGPVIHSGSPAIVLEIRHVGPQGLQRFYHIITQDNVEGWISDYYVRRQVYVFNHHGINVPIYDLPGGSEIARLSNVTPVTLLQPDNLVWWEVSTLDGSVVGWVEAEYVKESPEEEFLIGTGGHEHSCEGGECPFFVP